MRAVSDAGPVIHLSWINHLWLLPRLFEETFVPPAVRDELLAGTGSRGLDLIQRAFADASLIVRAPASGSPLVLRMRPTLDAGESEAIVLAGEIEGAWLLSDDRQARRDGANHDVRVIGTLGLLTRARRQGLIVAALPLALELRRLGQWISPTLLEIVEGEEAQ